MRFARTLLILLCMLRAACALSQHLPMVLIPGSPHGIFQLFQDRESRLWLGTIDDVEMFDGSAFYSLRPYGFPHETPNAFAEDDAGGIWIGTQGTAANNGTLHGGLYRYAEGRVEKLVSGDVLGIAAPAAGSVFAAIGTERNGGPTYGDLVRLTGGANHAWRIERVLNGQADHLTVDHQGRLLFPCPGGWCEVAREELAIGSLPLPVEHHSGDPLAERVLRDSSGCVWLRSEAHGSYQCPGDAQPVVLPLLLSQDDSSAHLEEDKDGNVLMLVPMLYGRPGRFHRYGIFPVGLDTAMTAQDGSIWVGTDQGLYRMPYPFHLQKWGAEEGVTDLVEHLHYMDGRLTADNGRSLMQLLPDRKAWKVSSPIEGIGRAGDFVSTADGNRVVTGVQRTVAMSKDGRILASLPSSGYNLARTADGRIWMGSKQGISELSLKNRKLSLHPQPVSGDVVADMRYDAERDILWACDGKQAVFRKGDQWHVLDQQDGLLNADCRSIHPAINGDVWINYGAAAYGVIHNPASGHPTVVNYDRELNKVDSNKRQSYVRSDLLNRMWRSGAEFYVGTPDGALRGDWIALGPEDGIGPIPNPTDLAGDPDGSIWLIVNDGILHFSPPADFATNFPIPQVFISSLAARGEVPKLADAQSSVPDGKAVRVHLGSLQFDRRSALRFSFRVLPRQSGWTEASTADIELGKLRWGHNLLQVRARVADGRWSPVVERSLYVPRPAWAGWPALGTYSVALGGLTFGVVRFRRKRIRKLSQALPDLGEWRLNVLTPEALQVEGQLLGGRFQSGRVIARGGFAVVTDGQDISRAQRCAIKIFRQDVIDKEWISRRFQQEVLALEKIHHPNVVRIFGSGLLPGGAPYLVMEFIEGVTLRDLLETGGIAPERVGVYVREIGSALAEIHSHGICHRDLKPENLMLRDDASPGEEIVLIDFSIAIVKDPDVTVHGLSRAAGTISYMAPEQTIGYADSSTDLYSFARVIIELLTGRRLSDLLPDASMDLPTRVSELLPTLDFHLSADSIELLSSALRFDPAQRPKDARTFANRIAHDLAAVRELG